MVAPPKQGSLRFNVYIYIYIQGWTKAEALGILLAQLRSIGLLQHINKHPICTYTGECLSLVGFRSHLMVLGFSPCPTSTRLLSAQKHQPKAFFSLHAHPSDLLALWPGPWRVAPHLSLQCVPVAPVVFLGLQAVIGEKVRIEGSPPRPSLSPTWTCSDQLSPRMSSSSRWADWVCSPSEWQWHPKFRVWIHLCDM